MSTAQVEALLKSAMGLDAASIGVAAIDRAVQSRRAACGIADAAHYVQRLFDSPSELQELIEAVVVPETWFFRDREAFTALARLAAQDWLSRPEAVLRLLSLPCSTGEEPYSMAMALLDAGVPPERFRIDAVDISARALAQAERGRYGRNSFRGQDLAFRDRHFTRADAGWVVGDAARRQVRFRHGNLLHPDLAVAADVYDAIFCRNVLIYFDRDTQTQAIARLRGLMHADGHLFVAPAEAPLLMNHAFASVRIPMAFAFRKAGPQPVKPAKPSAPLAPPAPAPATVPTAQAFLSQALVADAAGDLPLAENFYRKALYLEPNQQDALAQLALLLHKRGDFEAAQVLRQREQRLMQRRGR